MRPNGRAGLPGDLGGTADRTACGAIVELRQYTLHAGTQEALIDLFDRELVESQEALGMEVIGQFRDLDDPDRFVWLRGFRDMPSRAAALAAFCGGPVWAAHRGAANATMIAWDDVLLLRPAHPGSGFPPEDGDRPAPGARGLPSGLLVATVYPLAAPADAGFGDLFEGTIAPLPAESGAPVLASFVTESSPNTHPGLPVREGEQHLVRFSRFRDRAAYDDRVAALTRSLRWRREAAGALARWTTGAPEVPRLSPTARSSLRG